MTRTSRKRRGVFAASGMVLALLAASCGSDGGSTTSATSSDPVAVAPIRVAPGGGQPTPGAAPVAAESSMAVDTSMPVPWIITDYVVGGELPAMPTEADGWRFVSGATPDEDAVRGIADALGVAGDFLVVPADQGGGWRIGPDDGSAPAVYVAADPQLSWWYTPAWQDLSVEPAEGCLLVDPIPVGPPPESLPGDPIESGIVEGTGGESEPGAADGGDMVVDPPPIEDCVFEEPVPPAGVPTSEQAEIDTRAFLEAMGIDPATLVFETYADDWSASVTAWTQLDGVRSPLSSTFGFGGGRTLEWAGGGLATPIEAGPYPLVSIDEALDRLRTDYGGWGAPIPLTADATEPAPGVAVDSLPCDAASPECLVGEPEEITVTVIDVRLDLWMVRDLDGTVWLLPAFTFLDGEGGTYTTPAVTDEFLVIEGPPTGDPVAPPAVEDPPVDPPVGEEPVVEPGDPDTPVASDPNDDPGTSIDPEPTPIPDEDAAVLLGLTEAEASRVAEENGWVVRLVAVDGEDFAVTDDYGFSRVNLELVDGVVTGVWVG